ncbi:TPS30 [Fagus crenata]
MVHCTARLRFGTMVFLQRQELKGGALKMIEDVIPEAIDLVAKLEQIASLKKLGLAIHFDVEIKDVRDLDNHSIHKEYKSCSRRGFLHYRIML